MGIKCGTDLIAHSEDERRFSPLAALLTGMARGKLATKSVLTEEALKQIQAFVTECVRIAQDYGVASATRLDCIRIIGHGPFPLPEQVEVLGTLLSTGQHADLQIAALDALVMRSDEKVAQELLSR